MADLSGAAMALDRGELVVLPTDTVYGIAAKPGVRGATRRLFEAKRRSRDLTLPVLCARLTQVEEVAEIDGRARALAERFWPGGLTIVCRRADAARRWDLGETLETVGVRIPDHPVALAVLAWTGPVAATSANLSGEPTPADCDSVRAVFGDAVSVYLCDDPRPPGPPSTVVDLTGRSPRILREGAIPGADVIAAIP